MYHEYKDLAQEHNTNYELMLELQFELLLCLIVPF